MSVKLFIVNELSFEEYLRRNPMPTRTLDNDNYKIIEVRYEE